MSIKITALEFHGMNAQTGRRIAGGSHLAQSISDILTTRIGSRAERREYGSNVPDLIDSPANAAMRTLLYAGAAVAIMRWEPRIRLSRVHILDTVADRGMQGQHVFAVEGETVTGPVNLEIGL
jgi:hypothetical protein